MDKRQSDETRFDAFEADITETQEAIIASSLGEPVKAVKAKKTGAGSRFVSVPAKAIHDALLNAGFIEDSFRDEIFYRLTHKRCSHISIKVYTSLPTSGGAARDLGEDAIRVIAIFEKPGKDQGRPFVNVFFKGTRVFRTAPQALSEDKRVEHVVERMLERAREAYRAANEYCKSDKRCYQCCGFPNSNPQPKAKP